MRQLAILFLIATCVNLGFAQNVGINNVNPQAGLDVKGDVIFRVDTLELVNGVNDNIDIGASKSMNYVITGPNTTFELGGFSGGKDGRLITLYNSSPAAYYVKNYSSGTAATNQIHTGIGADFTMNSYSTITLQYLAADSLWHVVSRYNEIGGTSGEHWTVAGNHIINTNSGNVGINVVEPLSRLSIDGELALMSDTIILPCAITMNQLKTIDNTNKRKSIIHLVEDNNCGSLPPAIMAILGGNDGEIIHLFTHINNTNIQHLGNPNNTFPPMPPTAEDSLNMIELYEPNTTGSNASAIQLKAGGVISLIYDGKRKKWKPVSYYGEDAPEYGIWYKAGNPNYMYSGASRVGIGTSNPTKELDIDGDLRVRDSIVANGNMIIDNNLNVKGNLGVGAPNSPYPFHINRNGVGYYQSWQGNSSSLYTYLGSTYAGLASGYGTNLEITNGSTFMKFVGGNVGISNNYAFSPNASLAVERGSGVDGTAAFFGTSNVSHFNYSTAEDTYLRGGKVSSKLILNDYGGQVTVGTNIPGNAQLNIASHRTGTNANGLSINQNTGNQGNNSYGLYTYANGGGVNTGMKAEVGPSGTTNLAGEFRSEGITTGINKGVLSFVSGSTTSNTAGHFYANDVNSTQVIGVRAVANGNLSPPNYSYADCCGLFAKGIGDCAAGYFEGVVSATGNIYTNSNVYCTELYQSSDAKLKTNIQPIASSLSNITRLRAVSYNWRDLVKDQGVKSGFIAQELQTIFPELVTSNKEGTLAIHYTGLIPHLVKAIQEQQEMIDKLKSDNQALIVQLKNEINEIKKLITNKE